MKTSDQTSRARVQQRGQSMTEYIILVGLIAIFLITAVNQYAGEVNTAIQGSENSMNNRVGDPIRNAGGGAATSMTPAAGRRGAATSSSTSGLDGGDDVRAGRRDARE